MPSAWLRRKVFQPCDGGSRLLTIYLATLVCPISMPSLRNSPWIRGAPHSGLAMLISWISFAYVRWYSWSATTTSRLPAPIRSETRAMPTDDRIRLDDRQRIASLGKQSIEANKYQPIKNTKGLPSRSGAPQNVDLLPKHPDLCLQRCSRSH